MTMTAVEVFKKIQATKVESKKILWFSQAASPGEYIRQGDVYISAIENADGLKLDPKPNPQMAPGDTRGSRHILNSLENVVMYRKDDPTALEGPILHVMKDVVLEHPDHGHVGLTPGFYAITFQRQMAEELRRARD